MSAGAVVAVVLLAVTLNWLLTMWAVAVGVRSALPRTLRRTLADRLLAPDDAAEAAANYREHQAKRRSANPANARRRTAKADAKTAARWANDAAEREGGDR